MFILLSIIFLIKNLMRFRLRRAWRQPILAGTAFLNILKTNILLTYKINKFIFFYLILIQINLKIKI